MFALGAIRPARHLAQKNLKGLPRIVFDRNVHRKKTEKVVPVGSSFSVVYRLPPIFVASLINKFKKYQLVVFGAGTPITCGLHALQYCDHTIPTVFVCTGLASSVAVFSIGQLFTNLVGMVYISKDRSRVKISYLNFWGDRVDKTVDASDIVGISKEPWLPYDRLNVANDKTSYKISLRHGEVLITSLFKEALKYDPDAHVQTRS